MVGKVPPPHLSPFVDEEAEGYMPEYAKTVKCLQATTKQQLLPMVGMDDQDISYSQNILEDVIAYRNEANATVERGTKEMAMEMSYQEELAK